MTEQTGWLLTDDELAAIAVDRESFWSTPLPTVDLESVEDLMGAVLRGQRSLLVRGLLNEDGELDASLNADVAPLAGMTDTVIVYMGDEDFQRVSWAYASTHYDLGQGWANELVSETGIHRIWSSPGDDVIGYLSLMLSTAIESAPQPMPDGEPAWLCVAAVRADGGKVLAARRGQLRRIQLNSQGEAVAALPADASDVDAALDAILGGGA